MGTTAAILHAFLSVPGATLSLGQIANLSGVSYGDYATLRGGIYQLSNKLLIERVGRGLYRLTDAGRAAALSLAGTKGG